MRPQLDNLGCKHNKYHHKNDEDQKNKYFTNHVRSVCSTSLLRHILHGFMLALKPDSIHAHVDEDDEEAEGDDDGVPDVYELKVGRLHIGVGGLWEERRQHQHGGEGHHDPLVEVADGDEERGVADDEHEGARAEAVQQVVFVQALQVEADDQESQILALRQRSDAGFTCDVNKTEVKKVVVLFIFTVVHCGFPPPHHLQGIPEKVEGPIAHVGAEGEAVELEVARQGHTALGEHAQVLLPPR